MEIKIKFKTIYSDEFQDKNLLPEDFFDELNEDEKENGFHYLSMYKHLYEPWLYSGKNKNELVYFAFIIKDKNGYIESNHTFWCEGKCWIESYKEYDFVTKNEYQSMTVNINENNNKNKTEKNILLRFKPTDSNFFIPIMHNINMIDNGEETDIFIKTGFEE